MMGDRISPTSELTIAPKAAPTITPMARSTAFPRSANFLNSSIMGRSRVLTQAAPAVRHSRARQRSGLTAERRFKLPSLKLPKVGPKPTQGGTAPRNDGEMDAAPAKLGLSGIAFKVMGLAGRRPRRSLNYHLNGLMVQWPS